MKEIRTTERIYFSELDGLRFFAFLLVFIHHHHYLNVSPNTIFNTHGWIGVDVFFALSSFLFTKLLTAELLRYKKVDFRKFYIRRIFRILPIYFLFTLFSAFMYYVFHGAPNTKTVIRLVGLLTCTDNIFSAWSGYNPLPYVAHLWTISYEEQYYIFIPFVILFVSRLSRKSQLITFLVTCGILNVIRYLFILFEAPNPAIWVLPITHFDSILLGILIGFGGLDFLLKVMHPLVIGIIGIALFFLLQFLPNVDVISNFLILSYLLVGVSTSFILLSVMNSTMLKKLFSIKWLVYLGKRSYGLYLYHILGNEFSAYLTKHFDTIPANYYYSFLYSLSFTVFLAILSYKFIETPFLILKKRFEVVKSRPI